jgi:hypothetical protein
MVTGGLTRAPVELKSPRASSFTGARRANVLVVAEEGANTATPDGTAQASSRSGWSRYRTDRAAGCTATLSSGTLNARDLRPNGNANPYRETLRLRDRERVVHVTERARAAVDYYLEARTDPSAGLFVGLELAGFVGEARESLPSVVVGVATAIAK